MADRIILHIGLQKSGTTYLQRVLQDCGDAVGKAGLCYPLPPARRRRRTVESHEWATYGLLGTEFPWVTQRRADNEADNWHRLARQVRRAKQPVLLSAEALSVIRTGGIQRLVDEFDATRVEVVITCRSLGRSLPSLWQQHVRNGRSTSFERYLTMLADQRRRPAHEIEDEPDLHLWRAFAIGGLVRRWVKAVGLDRVQVVTATGSPPSTLWTRFVRAIGVPELTDAPPWQLLDMRTHSGLTAPEAQVLRRLNAELRDAEWTGLAAGDLRERIITRGFLPRPERGPHIVVPPSWRERVAHWCEEDVAELTGTGVAVVGDVADLLYDFDPDEDPARAAVSHEDFARATGAAILAAADRP